MYPNLKSADYPKEEKTVDKETDIEKNRQNISSIREDIAKNVSIIWMFFCCCFLMCVIVVAGCIAVLNNFDNSDERYNDWLNAHKVNGTAQQIDDNNVVNGQVYTQLRYKGYVMQNTQTGKEVGNRWYDYAFLTENPRRAHVLLPEQYTEPLKPGEYKLYARAFSHYIYYKIVIVENTL